MRAKCHSDTFPGIDIGIVNDAGSMLVAPAGLFKTTEEDQGMDATYVYARGRWKAPVLALPATKVSQHLH